MTEEERLAIQKAGANARAAGRTRSDNPYFDASRMPRVTGESTDVWQAKVAAWEFGWEMESAMRR